jgi:hypothetical protein
MATSMFYINQSGTNYQCIGQDGTVLGTSANADVVFNYAVTQANNAGAIFVAPNTTYNQTATIVITGVGTDRTLPASKLSIYGGGLSCNFNMTTPGVDNFKLNNNAIVDMINMRITQPDTSSGYGIFGADDGVFISTCCANSFFDELYIHGCDSTHACMFMQNPFSCTYGTVIVGSNNGSGVIFDATYPPTTSMIGHCGNCHFQHILGYSALYVLTIQALVTSAWINLMKFEQVETDGSGGAIYLHAANGGYVGHNWFYGLDLEALCTGSMHQVGIVGGTVVNNDFKGYMNVPNGKTAISISGGGSLGANTFDMQITIYDLATGVIFNDGNSDFNKNYYVLRSNGPWGGSGFTSAQFVISGTSVPRVNWQDCTISGSSPYAPLSNPNTVVQATVADGGTIAHGVGLTPTWVQVSGDGSASTDIISEVAASRTSTTCTIAIKTPAGAAGTTQTITLRAGWNSD